MTGKSKPTKGNAKRKQVASGAKLPTNTKLPASFYFTPKKIKGKGTPDI